MMRTLLMMTIVTLLSGCGCVLDPGDSPRGVGDYFDGCLAAAKREER